MWTRGARGRKDVSAPADCSSAGRVRSGTTSWLRPPEASVVVADVEEGKPGAVEDASGLRGVTPVARGPTSAGDVATARGMLGSAVLLPAAALTDSPPITTATSRAWR